MTIHTEALRLLVALEGALRGQGEETDELCAEARTYVAARLPRAKRVAPNRTRRAR